MRSQAKRKEPGSVEGRWEQKERTQNARQAARSLESREGDGPGRHTEGQSELPGATSEKPGNPGSSSRGDGLTLSRYPWLKRKTRVKKRAREDSLS